MTIEPIGNNIQLKVEEAKAGVLDTSSRSSAVEYGEVLAVGEEVKLKVKKGDKVFFKSWAADIITHEDKRYIFVNGESGGILAIIK